MHAWDWFTPIEETMRALDDLVRAGKVRYLGFSDTPAWKTTQAQMLARFRGWTPLVAVQIEYSLIERTVEETVAVHRQGNGRLELAATFGRRDTLRTALLDGLQLELDYVFAG